MDGDTMAKVTSNNARSMELLDEGAISLWMWMRRIEEALVGLCGMNPERKVDEGPIYRDDPTSTETGMPHVVEISMVILSVAN